MAIVAEASSFVGDVSWAHAPSWSKEALSRQYVPATRKSTIENSPLTGTGFNRNTSGALVQGISDILWRLLTFSPLLTITEPRRAAAQRQTERISPQPRNGSLSSNLKTCGVTQKNLPRLTRFPSSFPARPIFSFFFYNRD